MKPHEIEAYIAEPHKKSGDLMAGYRVALNPETWEKEREAARMEAEEAEADEEVDELEGEEADDDDEKPVKPKKRKRESEPGTKSKPRAKKEKVEGETTTKRKKTADKADKPPRSKKNGVKSKATVESEDDGDRGENAGPSKKASPPPAKKAKRDKEEDAEGESQFISKNRRIVTNTCHITSLDEAESDPDALKVKDWRHKLQRAFLGKTTPKEDVSNSVRTIHAIFR